MRSTIVLWREHCKVKLVILLLIQLVGISFLADAEDFSDISIPVRIDKVPEDIVLVLHKEKLSAYLEIALDDEEALEFLKEQEKKIEVLKQNLANAKKENKSEEELSKLEKEIKDAEKAFGQSLSQYEKGKVNIILKLKNPDKKYPGPIYFYKKKVDPKSKKKISFIFKAEGEVDSKIAIDELKEVDLSDYIEAELIVKDANIEVRKEDDEYQLNFDKAKYIAIKFHGKLSGKAELKYGVSPQIYNPIIFEEKRSPPGHSFKIKIPVKKIDEDDNLHIYFMKDTEPIFVPFVPVGEEKKDEYGRYYIFKPLVPRDNELRGDVKVAALIIDKDGEIKAYNSSKFEVKSQSLAIAISALIAIGVIYVIALLIEERKTRKDEKPSWLIAPLRFTETPIHRYSISLLQILIWSGIAIFAYLYVLIIKEECILLTSQILILLGISGGTALAAKATAIAKLRDIPDEYYKNDKGKDLRDKKREPKPSDYISIGGIPNLFKLQILGFTVITGIFVVWKLLETANFPEIPEELLTLMGISGGVYVGNEIATENVWDELKKKVERAEKLTGKKYEDLKAEVHKKLKEILS